MSHSLITRNPARELPAGQDAPTRWVWPVSTVAWSVVGALTPINYALPPIARAAWFAAIGAMILVPMLAQNVSRPLYPAIWIFVGYASIVSIFLATNRSTVLGNVFVGAQLVLLFGFAPFVLTRLALSDPKFADRFFISFIAAQTLSSFVGFLQSAGYASVNHIDNNDWYGRYPGLAEHQNSLGLMAALGTLLSLQMLTRGRRAALFLAAACVNIVGIVVSGSFSGVLALLLGLGIAALSSRNRRQFVLIFLMSLASVLAVWMFVAFSGASNYLPSFVSRYRQVTGQTRASSSVEGRVGSWQKVLETDATDLLFGQGLAETAGGVWADRTTEFVHNTVLRAWFQGGIFLGIAFALIVVAILSAVIRSIARKECGTEAGVLVAVLTYAMLSPLLEQRQFWLPVLIAWGSISAAAIRSRDREEVGGSGLHDSERSSSRRFRHTCP
jgi:O-antigen ligase